MSIIITINKKPWKQLHVKNLPHCMCGDTRRFLCCTHSMLFPVARARCCRSLRRDVSVVRSFTGSLPKQRGCVMRTGGREEGSRHPHERPPAGDRGEGEEEVAEDEWFSCL